MSSQYIGGGEQTGKHKFSCQILNCRTEFWKLIARDYSESFGKRLQECMIE